MYAAPHELLFVQQIRYRVSGICKVLGTVYLGYFLHFSRRFSSFSGPTPPLVAVGGPSVAVAAIAVGVAGQVDPHLPETRWWARMQMQEDRWRAPVSDSLSLD
jgi:hypothetical protein